MQMGLLESPRFVKSPPAPLATLAPRPGTPGSYRPGKLRERPLIYFISSIFWAKNNQKLHNTNYGNEINSHKIALAKPLANAKFD